MGKLAELVSDAERELIPTLLAQLQATRAAIGLPENMQEKIPAIDPERYVEAYNATIATLTFDTPQDKVAFSHVWIAATEDFYNSINECFFIGKSMASVITIIKKYFEMARRQLTDKGVGNYCIRSHKAILDAEITFLIILRKSGKHG